MVMPTPMVGNLQGPAGSQGWNRAAPLGREPGRLSAECWTQSAHASSWSCFSSGAAEPGFSRSSLLCAGSPRRSRTQRVQSLACRCRKEARSGGSSCRLPRLPTRYGPVVLCKRMQQTLSDQLLVLVQPTRLPKMRAPLPGGWCMQRRTTPSRLRKSRLGAVGTSRKATHPRALQLGRLPMRMDRELAECTADYQASPYSGRSSLPTCKQRTIWLVRK